MEVWKEIPLVTVKVAHEAAETMVTIGRALRVSVRAAGILPVPYTEIWDPYFTASEHLERLVTERKIGVEDPKVMAAGEKVRVGFRVIVGQIRTYLESLVSKRVEAAEKMVQTLPPNFDLFKGKRDHWVGEVQVLLNILMTENRAGLVMFGLEEDAKALQTAIDEYVSLYGAAPFRRTMSDDENINIYLRRCQKELKAVILVLLALVQMQPQYAEQVRQMLLPYLNLVERNQARRKKSTSDDTDTSTGSSNDETEEEEELEEEELETETEDEAAEAEEEEDVEAENDEEELEAEEELEEEDCEDEEDLEEAS